MTHTASADVRVGESAAMCPAALGVAAATLLSRSRTEPRPARIELVGVPVDPPRGRLAGDVVGI